MSYVNTPQPGRYTTVLLSTQRIARDPRHRLVAGAVVFCIVMLSVAAVVTNRRAAYAPMRPIIVLATSTPAPQATPAALPIAALSGQRWVVAFASGGRAMGAIPEPNAFT